MSPNGTNAARGVLPARPIAIERPHPREDEAVRLRARARAALETLNARIDAVPGAIERLLTRGLPDAALALPLVGRRWTITAAGIAEGPARFLAQLMGAHARFAPLSQLALEPAGDDALVIFSQGLSPNARIALARAERYRDALLFTSATDAQAAPLRARGICVAQLEPSEPECGMLLRVIGPAVGRAAALSFARAVAAADGAPQPIDDLARVTSAVHAAHARAAALDLDGARLLDPLVFIAQGADLDWCRALAWKWMEGLWTTEPPVWDVLQFAHGPLQAVHGRPTTIVALTEPASAPLFGRLERVLDRRHHTLVRSEGALPGPLAAFEHDVLVNELLRRALAAGQPRDLARWPAQNADQALYDLDAPLGD